MKRILLFFLAVCLFLSGCSAFDQNNFYALPKRSSAYQALQEAVESAMKGAGYSAPVSGPNRQAIQQTDLDGDGDEEVLVFCKSDGERPLRVLILDRVEEDKYSLLCTLEGEGSGFDSVQYAQIDGKPGQEILLSRRLGDQVQQFLSVYTLTEEGVGELMSSACVYCTIVDLDSDQRSDIFLLRSNPDGLSGFAEYYRFQSGELMKDAEANLSTGTDDVKRIITGEVAKDVPAVFVASAFDEKHLITDVFALENDRFTNISANDEDGQSSQTVRNYYVYSTDIDGDGVIEMPNTLPLEPIEGDSQSEGQYRIVWYSLGLDGVRSEKLSTYHNFADGWFLFLPEQWSEGLIVTRERVESNVSAVCFLRRTSQGTAELLLTIYSCTGEQMAGWCRAEGRFLLSQRGDVTFGALTGPGCGLSEQELQNRFSFISVDLLPSEQ